MPGTRNRYEWRAFATHFGALEYRLKARGSLRDISESREWYLVSPHDSGRNIKIRKGKLDCKVMLCQDGELEQWAPESTVPLPLTSAQFYAGVLEPLGIPVPQHDTEDSETLLDEHLLSARMFYRHPGLIAVDLVKRRARYVLGSTTGGGTGGDASDTRGGKDECLGELVELEINGATLRSICIESASADAVRTLAADLGLDAWRNRSYVTALREIMGLTPTAPLLR
ncbi:MAG: hypothetical protein LAT61_16140 [Alcanivorax sp.]|nr:hypothetical protein [Alcanivorax sp.]